VLFGMIAVDDLKSLRKLIFRDVPDPCGAVAEYGFTRRLAKAAVRSFSSQALDAPCQVLQEWDLFLSPRHTSMSA